jgi:hypothetical protein
MTFASTPHGCIKGRRNAFSDYTSDISNEVAENVSPSSYQPEFEQGLDFILNHFEEPLFPRTISTKMTQGRQIAVHNKAEALARFNQANGLDCRIAAYPIYTDYYIKNHWYKS